MNTQFNAYVERSKELLENKHKQKYEPEHEHTYKAMISYIEQILHQLKKDYMEYCSPNDEMTEIVDIATSNLTWIPELNQYGLKINGILIRGNLANIYDKKIIYNKNVNTHQIVFCGDGNTCQKILKEEYCKFYHDPLDLLELKNQGKISKEFYKKHIVEYPRNFSNTSWIYCDDQNKKNKYMRIIGAKQNLDYDAKTLRLTDPIYYKQIIEDLKQQIMHDILVLTKLENL
jgi:hypothetical protein